MDDTVPGYEIVDDIHNDDYEWTLVRIYRKDGRIFADTQSGCSCNWYETPSEGDLVELPNLAAAERYYAEHVQYSGLPEWLDVVERFRAYGLR